MQRQIRPPRVLQGASKTDLVVIVIVYDMNHIDAAPQPTWAPRRSHRAPLRLLGVWSHPDDEAYLAAGLMAKVTAAGGHVTTVAVTDGEGGFADDDPRPAPDRARQRRRELRVAMATVGVRDVRFLGIADGQVADADENALVARLVNIIDQVQPDVVVTFGPDGITGHPDHIATWKLASRAWADAGVGDLWYAAKTEGWLEQWRPLHDEFGVWMTEEPTGVPHDQVEDVIDLDGADLERKRAVLAAHASQTVGLAAAFGESRYCDWIRQEAFRRPTDSELVSLEPWGAADRWSGSRLARLPEMAS